MLSNVYNPRNWEARCVGPSITSLQARLSWAFFKKIFTIKDVGRWDVSIHRSSKLRLAPLSNEQLHRAFTHISNQSFNVFRSQQSNLSDLPQQDDKIIPSDLYNNTSICYGEKMPQCSLFLLFQYHHHYHMAGVSRAMSGLVIFSQQTIWLLTALQPRLLKVK